MKAFERRQTLKHNQPIFRNSKVLGFSFLVSLSVLGISLLIQWLVYDDWLHRTGPLRIVGTSIATVMAFGFVLRRQYAVREKQLEMMRRFEMILHMNDRIRNALQAIECVTYLSQPEATQSVKQSVDVIDSVLREVLVDAGHFPTQRQIKATTGSSVEASRRSA